MTTPSRRGRRITRRGQGIQRSRSELEQLLAGMPPPEASNIELDSRSKALIELANRLKDEGSMTFAEIDEIALRFNTVTADLLAYAEGSMNCTIDYAQAMVICR